MQFPSIHRRWVEWCLRVILQGIDVCQADGKGWRNYSEEDSDVEICCCLHRKAGKFLNVNRNVECVSDEMKELKYVFSKRSHRKLLSAFVEVVASTTTSIKSRMKLLSFSWSENQIGIFFCDICRCRQFFYIFLLFACPIKWELGGVCGLMNRGSFGSGEFIIRKFYNWIKLTTSSCRRASEFEKWMKNEALHCWVRVSPSICRLAGTGTTSETRTQWI